MISKQVLRKVITIRLTVLRNAIVDSKKETIQISYLILLVQRDAFISLQSTYKYILRLTLPRWRPNNGEKKKKRIFNPIENRAWRKQTLHKHSTVLIGVFSSMFENWRWIVIMASDSVFFFVFSNGSPLEVFENSSRRPFIFLKAKKQRVIRVGNRSSYLSPFSFPRVQTSRV